MTETDRVTALRQRLHQSEWIVCAEALRILDGEPEPDAPYCAMHKVKQLPRCRVQCPTCRIHDQQLKRAHQIAGQEAAQLGPPPTDGSW